MVLKKKEGNIKYMDVEHQRLLNWLYKNYPEAAEEYEEETGDERKLIYG